MAIHYRPQRRNLKTFQQEVGFRGNGTETKRLPGNQNDPTTLGYAYLNDIEYDGRYFSGRVQ